MSEQPDEIDNDLDPGDVEVPEIEVDPNPEEVTDIDDKNFVPIAFGIAPRKKA